VVHHAALHYRDLPSFFGELRKRSSVSARALAFTVLTAARSGEVRHATWAEVNLGEALWTIPGEHTKSRREHRVPLAAAAIAVLKVVAPASAQQPTDLIFPGDPATRPSGDRDTLTQTEQSALSENTMLKLLQEDMGQPDVTVHGFRSAFRDWGAEMTSYPRELLEAALAHVLKDKTEGAYQRGDLFDRRREVMDAWAKYCTASDMTDATRKAKKRS